MQPSKISIAELFQQREQYLIPLFQRGYVWTLTNQIQPLWEDIVDRVEALQQHRDNAQKVGADKLKPLRKHFLGAIVVGSPLSSDSQVVPTREVIDGQQRTTTIQIMLLALRDVLAPFKDEALDYELKMLTFNIGNFRSKTDCLKVWPTNVGRDVMKSLFELRNLEAVCKQYPVKGPAKEVFERPLMVQAYLFFHAMLAGYLRGKRYDDPSAEGEVPEEFPTIADKVIESIAKDNQVRVPFSEKPADPARAQILIDAFQACFQIMRLQLDDEDDPQIIFETLNARGAPLTPSDLIRNFIFLRASRSTEDVDELYDAHWRSFDEKLEAGTLVKGTKFWKREERQGRFKSIRLDLLFYHYMGLRKHDDVKVAHVFEEFKSWWDSEPRDIKKELERISHLARHFETFIDPGQKTRFDLFCRRMKLLDTATLTPLVFYLLEHHAPEAMDFIEAIRDLESYIVRRFVCGLTTKSYNRLFQKLLSEMLEEKKTDAASLRAKLLALEGPSQRWPRDDEFRKEWCGRRLYEGKNTRRVRAVLEGLELGLRTFKQEFLPALAPLSVEHVLPQGWQPADYPLPSQTPEAEAARFQLLHSLGNLTLVTQAFNSELSNKAFAVKRPELAANSSLMLNAYFQKLTDQDAWDETKIVARATSLFPIATQVWPCSVPAKQASPHAQQPTVDDEKGVVSSSGEADKVPQAEPAAV